MAKPRSKVSPKNREVPARQQQTQRAPQLESIPRLSQTRSQEESFAGGAAKTQMQGLAGAGARVYLTRKGAAISQRWKQGMGYNSAVWRCFASKRAFWFTCL